MTFVSKQVSPGLSVSIECLAVPFQSLNLLNKCLVYISNLFNPLSADFTKWSKHAQTICRLLPTNCLSMFDHFVRLALKGLKLKCRWWEGNKNWLDLSNISSYSRNNAYAAEEYLELSRMSMMELFCGT